MKSEIMSKIVDILVNKLGVERYECTPEANLRNDLGVDSLDETELIMGFEKEYKTSIRDEDVEQITTVKEIYDFIFALVDEGNQVKEIEVIETITIKRTMSVGK